MGEQVPVCAPKEYQLIGSWLEKYGVNNIYIQLEALWNSSVCDFGPFGLSVSALTVSFTLFAEDGVFISRLHLRLFWQLGHDFVNSVASLARQSETFGHSCNISVDHSHS